MNNILITSAGRRVGLVQAFQSELKKIFPKSKVFAAEANPEWSSACRVSDEYFYLPKVNERGYVQAILDICINNEIKVVIPTIDTELLILSKAQKLFSLNNIQLVISDFSFISNCRDKRKTIDLFKELSIAVPSMIDKNNPSFPLFIKPYDGSLSKDIYLIESADQLTLEMVTNPKLMFMEYINSKDFQEYTIDAYFDSKSFLKCLVPRKRIEIRGGEISKGKTERLLFYQKLKESLKFVNGARGCITFQFFINRSTSDIIGIEINPRFGGGYPLAFAAGANYPKFIIQEYILGESIDFFENWKDNLVMLRFDSEIFLEKDDFNN